MCARASGRLTFGSPIAPNPYDALCGIKQGQHRARTAPHGTSQLTVLTVLGILKSVGIGMAALTNYYKSFTRAALPDVTHFNVPTTMNIVKMPTAIVVQSKLDTARLNPTEGTTWTYRVTST